VHLVFSFLAEVLKERSGWRETCVGIKMGGSPTADMCLQRYTAVCGEHAHSAASTRWLRQTRAEGTEEVSDAQHALYRLALVGSRYVTGLAHSALHEKQLYHFHAQLVPLLQPVDSNLRFQFCRRLLHRIVDESELLCRVLCTDEAAFTRSGVNTLHSLLGWTIENPYAT
jgi:hypothetical protein